ncbi:MAG: hypothetical protein LBH00_02115 [Planctomycetaceae bacterium]|jgi:hypothetical protein|nr:hypothetical protein [Planctomycetaceae bacterium]
MTATNTEQLPPYSELRRQIDELVARLAVLREKENEVIRQMFPAPLPEKPQEILLLFNDQSQTVSWFEQTLKLGGKSYRFLQLLWNAPRHRKKIEPLTQSVWKTGRQKRKRQAAVKTKAGVRQVRVVSRFVPQNTLKQFLFRLQNRLRAARFPYKIVPVKSRRTREFTAYQLKCHQRYAAGMSNVPQPHSEKG